MCIGPGYNRWSVKLRTEQNATTLNCIEALGEHGCNTLAATPREPNGASGEALFILATVEQDWVASVGRQKLAKKDCKKSIFCNLLAYAMTRDDPMSAKVFVAPRLGCTALKNGSYCVAPGLTFGQF